MRKDAVAAYLKYRKGDGSLYSAFPVLNTGGEASSSAEGSSDTAQVACASAER